MNIHEKRGSYHCHRIENTLWIALRIMEERHSLLMKLAENERTGGKKTLSGSFHDRAKEIRSHIDRLKLFIFNGQDSLGDLL